jgi:threonine/homoserine/homoserine lactone efflux protein
MAFSFGSSFNKILGSELGEMIVVDLIVIFLYLLKVVKQSHFIYAKLAGTALLTYLHFA